MNDLAERLNIAAVEEFGFSARAEILRNPRVPKVFCIAVFGSSAENDLLSFVNNTSEDEPFLRSVRDIRSRLRAFEVPPVPGKFVSSQ